MLRKRRLQEKNSLHKHLGVYDGEPAPFSSADMIPVHSADEVAMRSESFNLFSTTRPFHFWFVLPTISFRFCFIKRVRPTNSHCSDRVQGICVYSVEPFPCSSD
jgi:hypothetical protein